MNKKISVSTEQCNSSPDALKIYGDYSINVLDL